MSYQHKNKELMERIERISVTDYVRDFLIDLGLKEGRGPVRLNKHFEAERVKGMLNIPKYTRYKALIDPQTSSPYWDEQLVDYLPSNLGRGYIFYFICSECGQRCRYLYEYNLTESPLCRQCCRITYRRK